MRCTFCLRHLLFLILGCVFVFSAYQTFSDLFADRSGGLRDKKFNRLPTKLWLTLDKARGDFNQQIIQESSLADDNDEILNKRESKFNENQTDLVPASNQFNDTTNTLNNDAVSSQKHILTNLEIKSHVKLNQGFNVSNPESRKEIQHVAFLKVHKCGSSTVQNIFLRFVDSRNLTMVFGHSPEHPKTETRLPNVISYLHSLTSNNIVPPPPGRHYDILCCHVIYNETQFKRYMPRDTVMIGIVREPFRRLESSIRFFNSLKNTSLTEFANDPFRYNKRLPSMNNNRMAYEFGFPLELFPSMQNPVLDKDKVNKYIQEIHRQFDCILVNEMIEKSLVYMRRLLGWKMEDIIFMNQQVAKMGIRRFTPEDKTKLSNYLYLDITLYNSALQMFDTKFKKLGQDALDEVKAFKDMLRKVDEFCLDTKQSVHPMTIPASKWNDPVFITPEKCQLLKLREMPFVQKLRQKIYGTLDN